MRRWEGVGERGEATFLEQLASEDSDDTRLVYADWLEEKGDIRAEYLRLEVSLRQMAPEARVRASARARMQALASSIDPAWRERIDRVPGLVRPPPRRPAPTPATPSRPGPAHVPSWARLSADALLSRPSAIDASHSDGDRAARFVWLVVGVVLFLLALGSSGCVFVTHLACGGGDEGVCTVDVYGIFARERHVEVPVSDIVEIAVDERTSRRGTSTARVTIVTRSRGPVDLSGRQLLVSVFAVDDAVAASAALRRLATKAPASRRVSDVDLWLGPPRLGALIWLAVALVSWMLLVRLIRRTLREWRGRAGA